MVRIFRLLIFLLFSIFYLQESLAQYVNVDSLVIIPGPEKNVSLSDYQEMVKELQAEVFSAGQDFFYGHDVPAGSLLRYFTIPSGGKVISRYGWRSGRMHTGTDIKLAKGDTIYAAFQGTVTRAKYHYGYGNMVVLDHGINITTSYAHLSAFLVKEGEFVRKLQPIGLAGSTGRATTSHLHFEIRQKDKHFNPELIFDFENGVIKEQVYPIQNLADLLPVKKQQDYEGNGSFAQSHIVSYGDSLWKISRRYKTSVKTLCQLNGLTESSVLNIGMVLKLF